jgi:hypothetical protein
MAAGQQMKANSYLSGTLLQKLIRKPFLSRVAKVGILSRSGIATSSPRKNLVLPQGKSHQTRAFSLPQDSSTELMFEPCGKRRPRLSVSPGADFLPNNTGPGPCFAFERVARD